MQNKRLAAVWFIASDFAFRNGPNRAVGVRSRAEGAERNGFASNGATGHIRSAMLTVESASTGLTEPASC